MSKTVTRRPGRWARLGLLAALPLLLSGCFRVDLAIHVNDDGSGTMTMLVAFDESLLGLMQGELAGATDGADGGPAPDATPADPLELFGDIDESELPPGVSVEPYEADGFVGARITFPFEETDDVAASLEEAFASSGEAGPFAEESGAPLENFVLREQEDGGWRFEASAESPMGGEDAGTGDAALDGAMTRLLLADAAFTVRVRLPGDVVETNADERGEDGELIWHIDPAGDDRMLFAQTEPASGGLNALLLGGAAALAVAAAVIALGYWVRRRPAEDTGTPDA